MKEFSSFGDLAAFMERQAGIAQLEVHKAVREGAELIWMEARDEIGHYQAASGPFPEWPALADTTLDGYTDEHGHYHPGKVEMGYSPPDNPLRRTGELRAAIEMATDLHGAVIGVPDRTVGAGTPEDPIRNVGDVAVDHEFGTSKMPARSFLGRAAHKKAKEAVSLIAHAFVNALSGRPNVKVAVTEASHEPPF